MPKAGNIAIVDRDASGNPVTIYLSTLWSGHRAARIVQSVLRRKRQWDSPPCLARMLFCELLGHPIELGGEIGFGIGAREQRADHDTVIVDPLARTVLWCGEVYTFDRFIRNLKFVD